MPDASFTNTATFSPSPLVQPIVIEDEAILEKVMSDACVVGVGTGKAPVIKFTPDVMSDGENVLATAVYGLDPETVAYLLVQVVPEPE